MKGRIILASQTTDKQKADMGSLCGRDMYGLEGKGLMRSSRGDAIGIS